MGLLVSIQLFKIISKQLSFYRFRSLDHLPHEFGQEVEYLQPADEREPSKKPHGASYSRQLVHKLVSSVLDNYRIKQSRYSKLLLTLTIRSNVEVEKEIFTSFK